MSADEIEVTRDCEVVEIPGGQSHLLKKGTAVSITQALGGSYTLLVHTHGGLFRLAGRDADAIGKEETGSSSESSTMTDSESSTMAEPLESEQLKAEIWARLKTCFDPEIPVNIVDLGLIYDMTVSTLEAGGNHVAVQMTLTAQGCGMGDSIAADAQHKIQLIPQVTSAAVQVVWEPPWTPDKMSTEGKAKLGIG